MAYLNNTQDFGFYVVTTNIWEIQQRLDQVDINSPEFKKLLVDMYQNINKLSLAVNARDNGFNTLQEVVTNQQWFSVDNSTLSSTQRPSYRIVINFGALPNATTKSVPHNIMTTSTLTWTRIQGAATNSSNLNGIPLPFASTMGDNVQLDVDSTNVNVSTTIDYSEYDISYIILEYLKS